MGYRDGPGASARERFDSDLVARRAEVRAIHERLFYRPLLEAFAASPATGLTSEGAVRQLAALGFQDAAGARRAFEELTSGLSRRSRLMQQLLPLMLGWLSASPDPDLGLEQLRLLVAAAPDHAALIAALRDNPVAAERLCTLLGTSRLLGRLLDRLPPALARLGDDAALAAFPGREALIAEAARRIAVRPRWEEAVAGLHRFVEAHVLWLAAQDLVGGAERRRHRRAASATWPTPPWPPPWRPPGGRPVTSGPPPPPMAVIAMGRWGGRELNYASDLDALVVYRAGRDPGADQACGPAGRRPAAGGPGPGRAAGPGPRPRPGPAPRGQAGGRRPLARRLHRLLGALGRDLGAPGAAARPPRRRRPRARRRVPGRGGGPGLPAGVRRRSRSGRCAR